MSPMLLQDRRIYRKDAEHGPLAIKGAGKKE
jgi:hypothetical protein